ncbi:MAG: diguanylate cyclase [Gammaproteobacteria bacterium]|nr:diguanylate cyclase [Gammaproteobacteria bacterium]
MFKKSTVIFNLKFIYAFVFVSLACWALFAYITTTEIIKNQQAYAHIINLTGKQRMLSQKIALMANQHYESRNKEDKKHLFTLYSLMQSDHASIISVYTKSEATRAVYFSGRKQLDKKVKHYFKLVNKYLVDESLASLYQVESYAFSLLPLLDEAVTVFENESREKTDFLLSRELFILAGIIITLILESIFIVIPAIRYTKMNQDKLKQLVRERTRELEELSVTDQLTNIYNRRKIDETLSFEIERASRSKESFGVIMVDIDKFKNINDTYGHLTGDNILKNIAGILFDNVRKSDVLGRWGGEEFLIVDSESDIEKIAEFAEKMRKAIEHHDFHEVGKMTCSFGVTRYIKDDTASSLVIRADKALYMAKESGRNCVKEIISG